MMNESISWLTRAHRDLLAPVRQRSFRFRIDHAETSSVPLSQRVDATVIRELAKRARYFGLLAIHLNRFASKFQRTESIRCLKQKGGSTRGEFWGLSP